MCRACGRIGGAGSICPPCGGTLVPAVDRVVDGVVVRSAWAHQGAAQRLVHRLKYQGTWSAAVPVVDRLVELIGETGCTPSALVPLPRARLRRGVHGIDPASVLASALGSAIGVPVIRAVSGSWWWPRHAGRGADRPAPVFRRSRSAVTPGAAFVDDVVTTGSTLAAAARLVPDVTLAFTATSVERGPALAIGTSVSSRDDGAE